jgi:hypothetical protein
LSICECRFLYASRPQALHEKMRSIVVNPWVVNPLEMYSANRCSSLLSSGNGSSRSKIAQTANSAGL